MKRFVVGYESLCRIIMMIVVVWGRLPGMDVHVLEPIGQDQNAGPAGTTPPARKDNLS